MNNSSATTELVKNVWANRQAINYKETKKTLEALSHEELEALNASIPVVEQTEVSLEIVTNATNISSHVTSKGEPYFCISLELVETNGLSFKFKHNDSMVVVANDMDLYKLHKSNPIAIGTEMLFNYEGTETFKKLDMKGTILVANNSQDNPYRGTISKSNNACFIDSLAQKAIDQMERKIALMETADELGVSVRKVRQVLNTNLSTDIASLMKAKLAK
jgi:hypothetical protein